MRVGINGWFWGQLDTGLGQYTTYLAAAFAEISTSEVVIIAPQRKKLAASNQQSAVSSASFTLLHSPLPIPRSPLARLWFEQVTFPRLCHRLGVDVAFVPQPGMPLRPRLPTFTTIHDLIPLLFPAYRSHPLLHLYMRLAAAAWPYAQHLLTVSQASRQDMVTHLALHPEQITVLHPAAAPHFHMIPTPEAISQVRQQYHLPEQFILYLGGYGVHKNVLMLMTSYAKLPSALQHAFPLVLAGRLPPRSNRLYDDPRPHCHALNLTEHVHLPGPITEADKPALFAAATLFTYPSLYEGFGLPVLEALHTGTPVLASRTSSLPEVADEAAHWLPPDNPDAWAEAMAHLCTHPTERTARHDRGRAQAQKFTWTAAAHGLQKLLGSWE